MNEETRLLKITNEGLKEVRERQEYKHIAVSPEVHEQLKRFCKKNGLTLKVGAEIAISAFVANTNPIIDLKGE